MKMLVLFDDKPYSQAIVKAVSRLARNTLADLVLLAVQEDGEAMDQELAQALLRAQQGIYGGFSADELPYAEVQRPHWEPMEQGWRLDCSARKQCELKLVRGGSVAKTAVAMAAKEEAGLVVLGCSAAEGCEWAGELNVPLRIAEDAPCHVLVIKEPHAAGEIVSILDQTEVSQEALEMINQVATIHQAGLKIVGVAEKKESRQNALEQRMVALLKYYNDRGISTWLKVLPSEQIQRYVTAVSQEAVVALWMGGHHSLVKKLFARSMIDRLLEVSRSSLLILR